MAKSIMSVKTKKKAVLIYNTALSIYTKRNPYKFE